MQDSLEKAVPVVINKIRATASRLHDSFPHVTSAERGPWIAHDPRRWPQGEWNIEDWTTGFWPGLLWIAYRETGDSQYRDRAIRWLKLLAPQAHNSLTSDLGFIFYPSFVQGYRLTGDPSLRETALTAAHTLAGLFRSPGGFLQAWGRPDDPYLVGRAIIDTMMNLPLLWWATATSGDPEYRRIAHLHAETTLTHFLRDDGSTVQVVEFDPASGEVKRKTTPQGLSGDSCWSRGQAWALYGFTLAYRETRHPPFRTAAEKVARYFLSHLPPDRIPYWDFCDPTAPDCPKDSSAAAIASTGLRELSNLLGVKEGAWYRDAAREILASLVRDYLNPDPEQDGILLHGCYHRPAGRSVDSSLIWGDFYFAKALALALKKGNEG